MLATLALALALDGCTLSPTTTEKENGDTTTTEVVDSRTYIEHAADGSDKRVQHTDYSWVLADASAAVVQGLSTEFVILHFPHAFVVTYVHGGELSERFENEFECLDDRNVCGDTSSIEVQLDTYGDGYLQVSGHRERPVDDDEKEAELVEPRWECETQEERRWRRMLARPPSPSPPPQRHASRAPSATPSAHGYRGEHTYDDMAPAGVNIGSSSSVAARFSPPRLDASDPIRSDPRLVAWTPTPTPTPGMCEMPPHVAHSLHSAHLRPLYRSPVVGGLTERPMRAALLQPSPYHSILGRLP